MASNRIARLLPDRPISFAGATTQLGCGPALRSTALGAPGDIRSVRGLLFAKKNPAGSGLRDGVLFRWAAPAGANGIGAEHLAAVCHAATQGQASLATGGSLAWLISLPCSAFATATGNLSPYRNRPFFYYPAVVRCWSHAGGSRGMLTIIKASLLGSALMLLAGCTGYLTNYQTPCVQGHVCECRQYTTVYRSWLDCRDYGRVKSRAY
jgi:hypothetical protein